MELSGSVDSHLGVFLSEKDCFKLMVCLDSFAIFYSYQSNNEAWYIAYFIIVNHLYKSFI